MSHGTLREEKTCSNCGQYVEKHFCPSCGQSNTVTRQPFYFLITHFVEDFLHYDGGFLDTIKRLFFRPGRLTRDYLAGKRVGQVNPVKLYIFVSFVTFFLISLLPSSPTKKSLEINTPANQVTAQLIIDSLRQDPVMAEGLKNLDLSKAKVTTSNDQTVQDPNDYPIFLRPIIKKVNSLIERGWTAEDVKVAFVAKYTYYFPKVLFVYLPIFAFFLWLFYDKKKFWYFDHGIFTLHYLTMSLISISLIFLLASAQAFLANLAWLKTILDYLSVGLMLNMLLNFYLALYRCYKQSIAKTIWKGTVVMMINVLVLGLAMLGVLILSFMNI